MNLSYNAIIIDKKKLFKNSQELKQIHVIDKDSYETGGLKLNALNMFIEWLKVYELVFIRVYKDTWKHV